MNFLEKLLKATGKDPFGIDASILGIRQLTARVATETEKLADLQAKLRDEALSDPSAEIDELPVIRQQTRIKVFESALKRAVDEAGRGLDAQMESIKQGITDLETKQKAIKRQRDEETLRAIRTFMQATGARLVDMPRVGHGGAIQIPSTHEMTETEVKEYFSEIPKPEQTPVAKKLDDVISNLRKLQMVKHLGGRKGIESLAG